MAYRRSKSSVEESICKRCNLLTPAWRTECIHCELPVEPLPGAGNGLNADGSGIEQRPSQEAR